MRGTPITMWPAENHDLALQNDGRGRILESRRIEFLARMNAKDQVGGGFCPGHTTSVWPIVFRAKTAFRSYQKVISSREAHSKSH